MNEIALWDWIATAPNSNNMLFEYLRARAGSISIAVISERILRRYIDNTANVEYIFALQMMLPLSDDHDNNNLQNMVMARKWQEWIKEQNDIQNYPNFGSHCFDYRIATDQAPTISQIHENNLAKYDFFATINYNREEIKYG